MTDSFESELVRKSVHGDQQAYTKLVPKYSNVIYNVIISKVSDIYFAQDGVVPAKLTLPAK